MDDHPPDPSPARAAWKAPDKRPARRFAPAGRRFVNRDPARLGRSGRPRRRAPRPSAPCPGILPAPHSVTRAPLADHAPDAGDAARRRARVLVRPPPPWSGSSQTASHIRGLMWPPAGGPPPRSGRRSRPTAAWACCIGRGWPFDLLASARHRGSCRRAVCPSTVLPRRL